MNIQVDNHAYPLQTYTPAAQSPAADSWDDFDATMVPASLNVRGSSQSTRLRFTASDESTLRDSFDQGEHVQQRQQQQQQQPQLLHRPSEAFLVDNASTHPAMIQRSTSPPRQHPIALQPPARHPGRPVTRGPVIAELEATTPASSLPPPHLDLWKTSYAPTPMISRQPRSEPAHDNDTQVRQSTYLADLNRRTGMVLGPTQQELLFPRLSQLEDESRQLARQSEQSSASKRGKCDFSILTVLLVALCALLVGGGLGGGIAAAVMGAHGKASAATR